MNMNEIKNVSFADMKPVEKSIENETVVITEEFLVSGMTKGCGIKNEQLRLLGVQFPVQTGWKQSLIGKTISKQTADKYISLKGSRKKKNKKNTKKIKMYETEKTESISLNHWESSTIYQLVQKQYSDISDALQTTEAAKIVTRDYNRLMRKLEAAIRNTSEWDYT